MMLRLKTIIALALPLLFFPFASQAAPIDIPTVKIWGSEPASFVAFKEIRGATGGSVTFADTNGDGISEIIVSSGNGIDPRVNIYKKDGTLLSWFLPYETKMKQGVHVIAANLDEDTIPELIVSPQYGGSSEVRVFKKTGAFYVLYKKWNAFEDTFSGGVAIAAADINADDREEIIVSSGPGRIGEIRTYTTDGNLVHSFFPFEDTHATGVNIATGDINGDCEKEIIASEASKGSRVRIFSVHGTPKMLNEWNALQSGGVTLATADTDYDGKDEIITASNGDTSPTISIMETDGTVGDTWNAASDNYRGAIAIAAGRFANDEALKIVTMAKPPLYTSGKPDGKYIEVELKNQRFYAWNNGYLARTFLISSGARNFPTPIGEYSILTKPLVVNYTRIYGPNDPRNYSFPNTKYNLMFKPSYYIHTAYWHNDFGHPRSHGCVNAHFDNAEWIYYWADLGTPVSIKSIIDDTQTKSQAEIPRT